MRTVRAEMSDLPMSAPQPAPVPSVSTTKRASVACNACKLRKVRCNGARDRRCNQCEHLDLTCEYTAARQSRKPLQRGRVIALCRDTSGRATSASAAAVTSASPVSANKSVFDSSESSALFMSRLASSDEFDDAFFLSLIHI